MSDKLSVLKVGKVISIALGLSVSLISFNAYSADKPVATVNGKAIDKKTFDAYSVHKKTQDPKYDVEKNRETLIQELRFWISTLKVASVIATNQLKETTVLIEIIKAELMKVYT